MARATTGGKSSTRSSQVLPAHGEFAVIGLSCAADAAGLERRLRWLAGVDEVTVNP